MANYYGAPPNQGYGPGGGVGGGNDNLQFYPSTYAQPVSGHATPSQAAYGYGGPSASAGFGGTGGFGSSFANAGGVPGVSGRMGEQGGLRTGWLAALSTEGYETEPPLLQELGINMSHVQAKTLAVLNPFGRIDQHLMDDSDLAGPILFCVLYGTALLLSGRVNFGFIYGLAVLGSIALHLIISLMAPADSPPPHQHQHQPYPSYPGQPSSTPANSGGGPILSSTLTFTRSTSVLGYCLLPLVATSFVGIIMPMDTPLGILLTLAAIVWCTWSASGIFMVYGRMTQMRLLVAYPLALFYVAFGIMGVFSSRGSGAAGAAGAAASLTGKVPGGP